MNDDDVVTDLCPDIMFITSKKKYICSVDAMHTVFSIAAYKIQIKMTQFCIVRALKYL